MICDFIISLISLSTGPVLDITYKSYVFFQYFIYKTKKKYKTVYDLVS